MGGQASFACDQVQVTEDWLRNAGQVTPYLLCRTTHWRTSHKCVLSLAQWPLS